jgi:putative heme-binding domain-containing protein
MRVTRLVGLMLFSMIAIVPIRVQAQKPAPVEDVSSFPPRTPQDERKALHVPPGFEVQLVASEPDIHKPLNIAFDDRGRLWVTDTVEYPYPAKEGTTPRDTVKILSDFAPDGKARSITTFADGLNIPIGVLPLTSANSALVHSIPNIHLMTDTDGDGKADERKVIYGVFGSRDTHGMTSAFTWGFDGWVYACHGFSNDSTVQGGDKKPITMNSGNTYRMRPDGSHAEYVTHGQVNPFGLAFDPLGNLYSCDCHSQPLYHLLRGAWYPSFGKPHDGLGYGPEMTHDDHGSTAICGISYYAADQFPAEYRDTTFIGNAVTNRINHDRIQWKGASPWAERRPDFVWSEDNWFRPVDIELGPDGALYVADFYNRIIGHYEVPLTHPGRDRERGRVWRIVYKGTDGKTAPEPSRVDRTRSTVPQLVADLAAPNLAVRTVATNELVERGGDAGIAAILEIMKPEAPVPQRLHGLWVLARTGKLDDATLIACAHDPNRELRIHALKTLYDRPALSDSLHELVSNGLKDADPFVRQAAAETLAAHPASTNVRPLLTARQGAPADDTHLTHAIRMALRDQLLTDDAWRHLDGLSLNERDRRDIADVTPGVHTAEAAAHLLRHLQQIPEDHEHQVRYLHHIARYGDDGTTQAIAEFVASTKAGDAEHLGLLRAIRQGTQERGEKVGEPLRKQAAALAAVLLDSKKVPELHLGIEAVRDFQLREFLPRLKDRIFGASLDGRHEALAAFVALEPAEGTAILTKVLNDPGYPLFYREFAAGQLGFLGRPEADAAILAALPTVPEKIQRSLAGFLSRRKDGAEALMKAIEDGKASARLLQERPITIGLESARLPNLAERIAKALKGLPPADQKLKDLLEKRRAGFLAAKADPSQGAAVFEKNCAACHQIGGKGAKVGPQLDGIGNRGLDRLLEDVLDPNRNVDQTFRTTNLALKDGQVVSGLLLREEGAVLLMADAQGKERRVPADSVEERAIAPLSPMPANMADQIAEPDFYRLLAYLLAQREGPATPAK